jgi:tight adherence protein B
VIRRTLAVTAVMLAATVSAAAAASVTGGTARIAAMAPDGPHGMRLTIRSPGRLTPADVSVRLGRSWAVVSRVHAIGPRRVLHLVLAVDTSGSMAGAPIAAAAAAGQQLLNAAAPGDEVGLVTFSDRPRVVAPLTPDARALGGALAQLGTTSGTALYDGVRTALRTAGADRSARRVVVVLSDGADTASHGSLARLITLLGGAGIEVDTVGLADSPSFDPGPLHEISSAAGGVSLTAGSVAGLAPLTAELSRNRLSTTYAVNVVLPRTTARDLHVSVQNGGEWSATLPAGMSGRGRSALDGSGAWLVVAIGAAAVMAISFLALERLARRPPPLSARLSRYSAGRDEDARTERASALSDLYELIERRLSGGAGWRRLNALCEQSGTDAPTAKALAGMVVSGLLLATIAELLLGWLWTIPGIAAGVVLPVVALRWMADRRAQAFEIQLPELLSVWASALRAGRSFAQALESIVDEAAEPARSEFLRAQRQVRLGVPIEQALDDMSKRLRSESFELVVLTTDVQRRVGGNVAVIFDQVADTVRKRQQFGARVRALTAMGRLSAQVLLAMPFVITGALALINHRYLAPLFETHLGHLLIAIALVMMVAGAAVLRRMVRPRAIA